MIVLLFKIPERILAYDNPSKLVCRSTMQLKHNMCTVVCGVVLLYVLPHWQVSVDHTATLFWLLVKAVPQGSVLDPLLFKSAFFINNTGQDDMVIYCFMFVEAVYSFQLLLDRFCPKRPVSIETWLLMVMFYVVYSVAYSIVYMHGPAQALYLVSFQAYQSLRFITMCTPQNWELYSQLGWPTLATCRHTHWYNLMY